MKVLRIELKNIDRSWTREQWKAISRWLRMAGSAVEMGMDWRAVRSFLADAATLGIGIMPNGH